MGIVSLQFDYVFKHLMANEKVLRHFLSDVLQIPLEEIRTVRPANTFLWKRYRRQKQGIVDILLVLNDDRRINIELQIKVVKHWDRRCLFYLSKTFTEDLLAGENYARLKKCISISILGFTLDDDAGYHHIYHLRDQEGKLFSDLLEVHIIELGKELDGSSPLDDWIRLFNARTEEDLDMIRTENAGIMEAVRELRRMSLGRKLRLLYEEHLKDVRDQNARDEYVRDEGIAIGQAQGERQKLVSQVRKKMQKGMSPAQIADLLEEDLVLITAIYDTIQNHPDWKDDKI